MTFDLPAAPEIIVPPNRRPAGKPAWSEERKDRAIALWKEGRSASQIAMELGGGLTRNAVIGKLHRHGIWRGEQSRAPGTGTKQRGKRRGGYGMRAQAVERRKELWATIGAEITDLPADTGDNPVTIFDVADDQCRWPVAGEGTVMLCCGGKSFENLPYCIRHCRMAYVSPARRAA